MSGFSGPKANRSGGFTVRANASFTRPADTTGYAIGDLIANNTVAVNVATMVFSIGRKTGLGGMIRRARMRKSGTNVSNASFRLHLYAVAPTFTNGDNGAWLSNGVGNYVGSIDITCDRIFSDGASGNGVPNIGSEVNFTADTYYGVLEARAGYNPASAETFTITLEVIQN